MLDKVKDAAKKFFEGFSENQSRFWIVGAAIFVVIIGARSCVTVEPGEVAVRVNNITGEKETITRPGMILRLPFGIHSVHILDASPHTFTMKGNKNKGKLLVRELTVRANDGSNFVFKDTTLIFRILGDKAQKVISDSGLSKGFVDWMAPYARSILRDEFGKESTTTVSDPSKFGEATDRAKKRLNDALKEHGLIVSKIVTPRPRFSQNYENLIEARNEAENQLTVIDSELERAKTARERKLAEVSRDENAKLQARRAQLENSLATAVTVQADTTRKVDTLRIQEVGKGQAALSSATRRAKELTGELNAKYSARKSQIDAFRTQPVERVMERLGERLKGVTISIQPWANDSSPSRIQISGAAGGRR